MKRKREEIGKTQSKITAYFPVIQCIQDVLDANPSVEKEFRETIKPYVGETLDETQPTQEADHIHAIDRVSAKEYKFDKITNNFENHFLQMLFKISTRNFQNTPIHNSFRHNFYEKICVIYFLHRWQTIV